jgi:hypothetical protein
MPLLPKLSNVAVNAEADAVCVLANSGKLRIYDGTQPATADTALSGQVLLAELTFNATAFGAASAGVSTANAITQDAGADATGTAAWFRALKSDGTTVLFDGSVGTSGANINLNSVAISAGAAVQVTSFTFTASKG